ncbi:Poly A polymerase [Quillaja saponaria]|uniref:Poly A polymerase n=1 Tax=Quillaja saponaria TaxID=32244 RepID=A0AAD7P8G5_QUISA|nr:Poly A polymerase [Quillaja saponaria]
MAIPGMKFAYKPHLPLRPPFFSCIRKVRLRSVVAVDAEDVLIYNENSSNSVREEGNRKASEWKKLNSKELGISTSMIARSTRKVLNGLKRRGYDVYLVGGCVRDLILKRTPKDFDIITSAELKEVMRAFSWCEIIGKRFPICHVHIDGTIVEVSSFSTGRKKFDKDFNHDVGRPNGCDEKDYLRWRNCLQRDFTINGLMFDPYSRTVYDYTGGIEDIKKTKVRTVIPAKNSFQDDCARILRAIRVAARLGFGFSRETAQFVKNLSSAVLRLDKGRLLMEINYMLAYGSAEASLRLLWKFGLLDILLPIQAAYFVRNGFRRRDKRTNMLLSLFSNLDKLLAPDRPCHTSLWVGLLALHEALSYQPRDPMVVAAFGLAVYNGGDMKEAVKIARRIDKPPDNSFPELLEPQRLDSEALTDETIDLAASVKGALCKMTDEHFVSQALADYPQAPYSDLVFIPLGLYLRTCKMFECVTEGAEKGFKSKQGRKINYESLYVGNLQEVRHVFARIVFDTVYPVRLDQDRSHA